MTVVRMLFERLKVVEEVPGRKDKVRVALERLLEGVQKVKPTAQARSCSTGQRNYRQPISTRIAQPASARRGEHRPRLVLNRQSVLQLNSCFPDSTS